MLLNTIYAQAFYNVHDWNELQTRTLNIVIAGERHNLNKAATITGLPATNPVSEVWAALAALNIPACRDKFGSEN